MSTAKMRQKMAGFETRIANLLEDFQRLVEDWDYYEEEFACAFCGIKDDDKDFTRCDRCRAEFCQGCLPKAMDIAANKKP